MWAQADPNEHAVSVDSPRDLGRVRSRRQASQPSEERPDREVELNRLLRVGHQRGVTLDLPACQPHPHLGVGSQIPSPGIAGGHPHFFATQKVGDRRAVAASAAPAAPFTTREPTASRGQCGGDRSRRFMIGFQTDSNRPRSVPRRAGDSMRLTTSLAKLAATQPGPAYLLAGAAVAARIAASRPSK